MITLQVIDRSQHGIVFQARGNDMIARHQQAANRLIESIRSIECEYNPIGRTGIAKEPGEHAAGSRDHLLGLYSQQAATTARVYSMRTKEFIHEHVNRFRLRPAGCRIVKVGIVFHELLKFEYTVVSLQDSSIR